MDIVLVGGLWLGASAWDLVVPPLEALGHRLRAVTLPGQGDGNRDAGFDDQVAEVVRAVDASEAPVMVVGHSAACTLAWAAANARPVEVGRVVMIGGFGRAGGEQYAVTFPVSDGFVRFPGWEHFPGQLSDDISSDLKALLAATAVPVPGRAALDVVHFDDNRRFDVPVTVICPEFTPEEAAEYINAGNAPELAAMTDLTFANIDSGHRPMYTRPGELASVLADLAG